MPRIRQLAGHYAEEDFLKEIKHRMIEAGIKSDRQLAAQIGIGPSTLCKRKQNIHDISISELQEFVRILLPDPGIVLRLVGYSEKEINRFLKDAAASKQGGYTNG